MKHGEMTTGELFLLHGSLNEEYKERLLSAPYPHSLCGVNFPQDLNFLTLDGLEDIQLSQGLDFKHRVLAVCRVVLGVEDERRVRRSRAKDICALIRFVSAECRRIGKVFESIRRPFTDEEKNAGIESLNFGIFGVSDWYCQRMGITDHNEAKKVPWVRVFKCMEMDTKTREVNMRIVEQERAKAERKARTRK